jgi:hypothetical protein
MTIAELIQSLQEIQDELGPETLVLGAHQPSWPLAENIAAPVSSMWLPMGTEGSGVGDEPVVWIPLAGHPGNRSPYAPKAIFEEF